MASSFLRFPTLLIACFATSSAQSQTPAPADEVLAAVRARGKVPGIAAAVVRDGKIIALGTSGVREIGRPGAIQSSDNFVIGSCTKPMTRLLLGRLAQAGKLKLDATLPQLLPGVKMRPEYEKVTLADLIAHTAGLPAYTRITPTDTPIVFQLKGTPMEKRSQFVEHVLLEPPAGTVGKDFVYSNAGFAVLGNILERAAGKPWETLIREEVFAPLGMDAASVDFPAGVPPETRPKGHERTPAGYELAKYSPPIGGFLAPAGGVVLPIADFARFAAAEAAVDGGRSQDFLKPEIAEALPNLLPPSMRQGDHAVFHGGQGTFTAACGVWPKSGIGIVVAVNAGDADEICDAAIDAMRAAFAPELSATGSGGSGPRLGVMLQAEANGPVLIESVVPGSLAERLGIQAGDEIATLDGVAVKATEQSALTSGLRKPGVKIGLRRGGKAIEVQLPSGPSLAAPAPR